MAAAVSLLIGSFAAARLGGGWTGIFLGGGILTISQGGGWLVSNFIDLVEREIPLPWKLPGLVRLVG